MKTMKSLHGLITPLRGAQHPSRSSFSQQVMPFMEPMHIIGSGSIGLLFSASIRGAFPSYPVSLLLRDHHRSNINNDNEIMVCLMKQGRPRMIPVSAQLISDKRPRPIQNLIVTTKAYAATAAVSSVLDRLDTNGATIILLCNGAFSVRDEIRKMLKSNQNRNVELILATTTHGAYQEQSEDEMYHVVHAGDEIADQILCRGIVSRVGRPATPRTAVPSSTEGSRRIAPGRPTRPAWTNGSLRRRAPPAGRAGECGTA